MGCYEKYRDEIVEKLSSRFCTEDLQEILKSIDIVSNKYEIVQKTTEIIVRDDDGFPDACKMYLISKKLKGLSKGVLKTYEHDLRRFFSMQNKSIEQIEANDVRFYLYMYKSQKDIKDASLNKILDHIDWFYKWAIEEGYVNRNPCKNVEKIKCEVKPREPLTQMELEKMRLCCRTPKERAILETLYSTGCRVSELTGLSMKDIDFLDGTVKLFGKGKKHRISFLNAKSILCLKDYIKSKGYESEYVFTTGKNSPRMANRTVQYMIKDIANRAGITNKNVSPHVIRHTTATIALQNGMNIEEVSKLLGHVNVDTTMIYAKINFDDLKIKHSRCVA